MGETGCDIWGKGGVSKKRKVPEELAEGFLGRSPPRVLRVRLAPRLSEQKKKSCGVIEEECEIVACGELWVCGIGGVSERQKTPRGAHVGEI